MTITTHGPSRFPFKYAVLALATAAVVLIVVAIGQWSESENQPLVLTPSEVVTESASPDIAPNSLSDALADGKLDIGLAPVESLASPSTETGSETVVITGQGSLYDALIAGKFSLESDSVQYVRGEEAAPIGLKKALADGRLDAGLVPAVSSEPSVTKIVPETVAVSGQGSLYEALAAGKFTTDLDPNVQYALRDPTPTRLWLAYEAGQLTEGWWDEIEWTPERSRVSTTQTMSGGHQE